MQDETVDRDPLEVLAEEFVERHRCGVGPTIEQYAQEHAEFAEEIRELFPAIVDIERLKQQQEQAKQPLASVGGVETDRIGDFHIVREIGRGGMGVVYEAEQQSLKRRVALKVLGQNVAGSERHLQRFRREAEAAARLHHTNIVPIYGTGDVDGIHFYAMQLIHGVGLDEVIGALRRTATADSLPDIKSDTQVGSTVNEQPVAAVAHRAAQRLREGAFSRDKRPSSSTSVTLADSSDLPSDEPSHQESDEPLNLPIGRLDHRYWRTVARIARDVAQAMDYAHRHGVLHRDIKPSNLLLDHEGIVWVADFGLAKHEDSDALTKTGDIVGTLRYMAPEQFHDQVTNRSDIYSLGLTLYEMLTLTPMFGDSKQGPLLKSKTQGTFVLPRSINSQIPADLETITLKASATDPAHRYRSAAEMAEDLDRYLGKRPILARPVSTGERLWRWCRRNPAVASLGSLAIVLLMLIAVILGWANYRTGLALETAEGQRKRAINAANEAMQQGTRAEGNLQLALVAFEGIMHNLASRGVPDSLAVDLGDGEVFYDVVVTNADAALLQTLLSFYDQFASQNETDLQLETATAYVRIGDIYQRLGNLEKASDAYSAALDVYDRLLESEPGKDALVLAKAEALNELAISFGRGGELDEATQRHREAEGLLKGQPGLLETSAGKFELARTLNLLGSRAFRAGEDRMIGALVRSQPSPEGVWGRGRGGPGGFPGRFAPPPPRPQRGPLVDMPDSLAARQLLEELVRDEPENMDYRLALANVFRMRSATISFSVNRLKPKTPCKRPFTFWSTRPKSFRMCPPFNIHWPIH